MQTSSSRCKMYLGDDSEGCRTFQRSVTGVPKSLEIYTNEIPTLGPKVLTYDLHRAIWNPEACFRVWGLRCGVGVWV